jgi:PRTRC genetic system protein A
MKRDLGLEGMLVDHFVGGIPDGSSKPVAYVMQGNGLWEVRRNPIGTFRRHLSKARIPGLGCDLREGFDLAVPKIPLALLWQAAAFFRRVFELHHSESIVRAVYNSKDRRYFLDCPPQEVSAAHCWFNRPKVPDSGTVVAEIHSHGGLPAGFSDTDDGDEVGDRFFGIVGRVADFFPQVCFRVSIGGTHIPVGVADLFNVERDPICSAKFPVEWLNQVREAPPPVLEKDLMELRSIDDPDDPENMDEDPEAGEGRQIPLWCRHMRHGARRR